MHKKFSLISIFMVCTVSIFVMLSASRAATRIAPIQAGYTASNQLYTATIMPDGGMSSILVGGVEFLNATNDLKHGVYFHQNGVIPLNITKAEGNIISAESDKASVVYEFEDNGITMTVTNRSADGMSFFIIFDSSVKAVSGPDSKIIRTPVNQDWQTATFYKDNFKITVSGATRFWGPWLDQQVFDASLSPGETRVIKLIISSVTPEEADAIKKITTPAPQMDADITVLSPMPWQVFQRTSRYSGEIFVSGRVAPECDTVMVKIAGKSLKGALPDKWQNVPIVKMTKSFTARIPVVPGGWYTVEFKALNAGKFVAQTSVKNVGVGEVFVGAGQSNSTNWGQERINQTSGMVSAFSGEFWQLANDPQPGTHDKSQGGSFWPAFGDAMYARYHVPIGVAVTGHGGTSVLQWQPDHPMGLFQWMMARINKLGPLGFRAVLWHQGETDATMPSEQYFALMSNIIRQSTALANWQFPWFVAHVSYINPDLPMSPQLRAAQSELWAKGIALKGPDTDLLTGDYRDYNGKGIHFSPKGLRAHGKMWAEKVSIYLNKVLDIDMRGGK